MRDHQVNEGSVDMEQSNSLELQIRDDIESTTQEKNTTDQPVSLIQLFRFASYFDKYLIAIAAVCAVVAGLCFPISIIFFGDLSNAFVTKQYTDDEIIAIRCNETNATYWSDLSNRILTTGQNATIIDAGINYAIRTGITAVVCIIMTSTYITCFNIAAENQIYRLRSEFMKAVLKQDISWYDTKTSNDFASRITEDLNKIQEGIGEKVGIALSNLTQAIVSVIISFIYGWELSLVAICTIPIMTVTTTILGSLQARLTVKELAIYAASGGLAEEIISAIRTVVVFGGEEKEFRRFQDALQPARKAGIRRGLLTGIGEGISWFVTYASYGLAFWYGIKLILDNCIEHNGYNAGSVNVVFFCTLWANWQLNRTQPLMGAFFTARGAAASIFKITDRVPEIDSSSQAGITPDNIQGQIRFSQVHFQYPSRPDVKILNGIDCQVSAGQTVAFVGLSGCGKSTCIQLLQRLYDPSSGQIELDGRKLSDLNVAWLRAQIGVVGQEPVLFGTTIAENIRYGLDGASHLDIERAAKEANAHDFISKLPLKYDTMVGERGAQLSGGQKQRIAIARALVRDPKILLLDEATSALDTQSEAVVQRALDKARLGRTTIIVAHRLTTVQNADLIFTFDKGVIKEVGNHETLMAKSGLYYRLVISQQEKNDSKEEKKQTVGQNDSHTSLVDNNAAFIEEKPVEEQSARDETTEKLCVETDGAEVSLWKMLQYNRPEWTYIGLGILGSFMMGVSTPIYSVVFGYNQGILDGLDVDVLRDQSNFYALMYVSIGVFTAIGAFLQAFSFSVAGEGLTARLRALTFQSILSQEMAFFDQEENSVGSLCLRLSSDASNIQGAIGVRIGMLTQIGLSVLLSLTVSIYLNWKLGLALSVAVPLILGAGVVETKLGRGLNTKKSKGLEKAGIVAIESISNIRTVASLGREETFHAIYMNCLLESHLQAKRNAPLRGILFAATINTTIVFSIASLCYGSYLISYEDVPYKTVLTVNESLIFGMEMVGQMLAFTPNYAKAKVAASRVFKILERKPQMESGLSSGGQHLDNMSGKVQMDKIHFSYPTRKDVPILRGFDAVVQPGQTVALVGQSGCGKSTCIQLLQRFYDPRSGTISIDDRNVSQVNTASLRHHFGIVSQEPVLFNRTISENISYGDLTRSVTMEEIIDASKKANIHNFIQSLPLGYDTMVGQKGGQLSGGQKQRVAIARALIRNPKVLLLDEATSALDSESEKVVQEALDNASQGRTCITIAHRLSTIQNADHIFVVHHGQVHEQGKHEDLLKMRGIYHRLWTIQAGANPNQL